MLRTSFEEGGHQERTESPKATSGAPNGFVRSVAVAGIFRPPLGGSDVSAVDERPAVPEKRKSSVKDVCKSFLNSLSSEEFSRRRQSFDTKTAIFIGQNTLKQNLKNCSLSTESSLNSECVSDSFDETSKAKNYQCATEDKNTRIRNAENREQLTETSAIKSSAFSGIKPGSEAQKEESNRNTSDVTPRKLGKATTVGSEKKLSHVVSPPSSSADQTAVSHDSEIKNGAFVNNINDTVGTTLKNRKASATECTEVSSPSPTNEKRRRIRPAPNACVSSSEVDLTKLGSADKGQTSTLDTPPKNRNFTDTESSQPPVTPRGGRRRRDRSQDTSVKENSTLNACEVTAEKAHIVEKISETVEDPVSAQNSAPQTKCDAPSCTDKQDPAPVCEKKRNSIEAADGQSMVNFRTCRRTSDVIAAKIQTIFSKNERSAASPTSSKSNSVKDKTSTATIKGAKPGTPSSETGSLEEATKLLKDDRTKNLDSKVSDSESRKDSLSTVAASVSQLPANSSVQLDKEGFTKDKEQNVKHLETAKPSRDVAINVKCMGSTVSQVQSKVISSDNTRPPVNIEKTAAVKNSAKDSKSVGNEKQSESISSLKGKTTVSSEQTSSAEKLTVDFASVKNKKSALVGTSSRVTSVNFLITEVSVENSSASSGKISDQKVSPVYVKNKEPSECSEQKTFATKQLAARKLENDASKVNNFSSKSQSSGSDNLPSQSVDKNKVEQFVYKSKGKTQAPLENLRQTINATQATTTVKAIGSGDTKSQNSAASAVENFTDVARKTSEKVVSLEKTCNAASLKENDLTSEISQLRKTSEVSKLNTISDTKSPNSLNSELPKRDIRVGKSLVKDTVDKLSGASGSETKRSLEDLKQKAGELGKQVAGKNCSDIVKTQGSGPVSSGSQVLKQLEKNKTDKPSASQGINEIQNGNSETNKLAGDKSTTNETKSSLVTSLKLGNSRGDLAQLTEKSGLDKKILCKEEEKAPSSKTQGSGRLSTGSQVLKQLEKNKADKTSAKGVNEVHNEKTETQKLAGDKSTTNETKSPPIASSKLGNSGCDLSKLPENSGRNKKILRKEEEKATPSNSFQKTGLTTGQSACEKIASSADAAAGNIGVATKVTGEDKAGKGFHLKENKTVPEVLGKKNISAQKCSSEESSTGLKKIETPTTGTVSVVSDITLSTIPDSKTSKKESAISENLKVGSQQDRKTNEFVCSSVSIKTVTQPANSAEISKEEIEVKLKCVKEGGAPPLSEQFNAQNKVAPKVNKVTSFAKKYTSGTPVSEYQRKEEILLATKPLPFAGEEAQPVKKTGNTAPSVNFSNSSVERSEKRESGDELIKEAECLSVETRDSLEPKSESAVKKLSANDVNDEFSICQDKHEIRISSPMDIGKRSSNIQADAMYAKSITPMDKMSALKISANEPSSIQLSAKYDDECPPVTVKLEGVKTLGVSQESDMSKLREESRNSCAVTDSNIFSNLSEDLATNMNVCDSGFKREFSSPLPNIESPRPPERKRSGFLRESLMLSSPPPRVPLRSMSRTGSLKRSDDFRLSLERPVSVLRSSSQSSVILGQSYMPSQRFSYTEMLSKLGTHQSLTSNRKFGTSQVSELWADLGEEQSNSAHVSEMLESETSERMKLEQECQELQSRCNQIQQKSDKIEMEMMEARVYRATEVNGDLSEDEENDATVSIYKQKYERAVRDMEIMKRRLQQQHEEEMEQSVMLKKATDKRLVEALEDVEEERQVVNQWKRKAQKLGAELQDLRLMLEEQMARNGELEKKQRRFDAELSAAQEDIRKEHQLREKLTRERDQAQLEKYSLEQELQATRLDMDMQHDKIALLNRELDELSLSSKGEEEVTQLKRAKQELERKIRDQEEELEELAGQVQMLEQAKLRLEMSLEKLRQEHRREASVRDEEIEEIRASSSKKIKNLEAQLENEQEERHQVVKQKHELERRIIELSDQPPPQDPEIERRLRRDLKRTKALLRDAQSMLEHVRDGQANKTLIRQLKNQLEDAEFTKSVAIKARQTAELELQELQSQLEEVTRTKNDMESRCLQLSREKSALQAQLEEIEEELAEIMKKYKAAVAQMSIDQKSLTEQNQQISELEIEKHSLKEQIAEMSSKLDHISGQTEDTARVHRLDSKVRDLESKLELEQTTRGRLEHQITRLKEQCDRSREECDSLRNKELQAQEGTRRLQRQIRELREDYAALQQKESEAYRKQHELEMALENTEADLQVTKNDLRLACQRIQDLQNALEDDLDSGTDVPDDSGSDSESSLDVSVLGRQCLTPLQRSDSICSNTSIGSEGRPYRSLSHSQEMAFFTRMMQRRTSMDFLM